MDWGDSHVVFDQLRVFDLVGAFFLQCRPSDFRIDDKGGALTLGIENKRLRRIRWRLRIEHIAAIANVHLGLEMRCLEMIVSDLEHLPESHVRIAAMTRQVPRCHAKRVSLDLK